MALKALKGKIVFRCPLAVERGLQDVADIEGEEFAEFMRKWSEKFLKNRRASLRRAGKLPPSIQGDS